MSLYLASLNSGSNGNCYYVGNNEEAVIVDAGISCRETEKRMKRCGLSMEKVKAIFITHEHSDHIRGVEVLSKKYRIPVYVTVNTLLGSSLLIDPLLLNTLRPYDPVRIGKLNITAFPKFHDASDPHSIIVEGNKIRAGVMTDIGTCCEDVIANFSQCHAVFLEANYDEEMLEKGGYPVYLKQRIRSDRGHLSNMQALELFTNHRPSYMKLVLLSHLSRDNNRPELVHELFSKHAGDTKVTVASRDNESAVYRISHSENGSETEVVMMEQLSLFE